MSQAEFQRNYFELFDLPVGFEIDQQQLGARYRQAQGELHPDRYAGASAHEQRLAVQYSALVNQAYATLRTPLSRATLSAGAARYQPAGIDQSAGRWRVSYHADGVARKVGDQ